MQDIASHIMDIAQNSTRANATRIDIDIKESIQQDIFSFSVKDNGCGMDVVTLTRVSDPFYTSRKVRKVGLGIPLLKQNTEQTGGSLTLSSKKGEGTTVHAIFTRSHLDCPPAGDIGGTLILLVAANPDIEFTYSYTTDRGNYHFNTMEIKNVLEGVPINEPEIVCALQEMVRENIKELKP